MRSDSETESESDDEVGSPKPTEDFHPSPLNSSSASYSLEALQSAIGTLGSIDADDIEENQSLHEVIHRTSSIILGFLSAMSSRKTGRDGESDLKTFGSLLEIKFMQRLFQLRRAFHGIATRETDARHTVSSVVCWVDVVLSRLGQAVLAIVGGPTTDACLEHELPVTLLQHKDEDALRAAVQLPHNWSAVAAVMSSEHASPAAVRLAICLIFAVYVMGPQLGAGDPWSDESIFAADPMRILKSYIRTIRVEEQPDARGIVAYGPLDGGGRVSHAMVISLFAAADSVTHNRSPHPFRPYIKAIILALVKSIMLPSDLVSQQDAVEPCVHLNRAQAVLISWGSVVPWCWSVWDDRRILDSEVIDYMTATWLYHLEASSRNTVSDNVDHADWEGQLVTSMAADPIAASSAMARLLHQMTVCLMATPQVSASEGSIIVMSNCCWAAIRLLQASHGGVNPFASDLCSALCSLFFLLDDSLYKTRDLIIEALSFVEYELFRTVVAGLRVDRQLDIAAKLEDKLVKLNRCILNDTVRVTMGVQDYHAARQMLQFLLLAWHRDVSGCFHPQSISSFLYALVNWLASEPPGAPCLLVLLDSLISTLAAVEIQKQRPSLEEINKRWEDDSIWTLAMSTGRTNILCISAFGTYVNATAQYWSGSPLRYAEAWGFLRDALLLVIHRQFLGTDEPLALIVCPALFRALSSLLQYADPTIAKFVLSSPWTTSFCQELQHLVCCETSDTYGSILQEKLAPFTPDFFKKLESLRDDLTRTMSSTNLNDAASAIDSGKLPSPLHQQWSLLYCQFEFVPRLLLVAETSPGAAEPANPA